MEPSEAVLSKLGENTFQYSLEKTNCIQFTKIEDCFVLQVGEENSPQS